MENEIKTQILCKDIVFETKDEAQNVVSLMLTDLDYDNKVYVAFQNWDGETRNEQRSLLITHDNTELDEYCFEIINQTDNKNINLFVFDFDSYKEAFNYCLDLKESF